MLVLALLVPLIGLLGIVPWRVVNGGAQSVPVRWWA